MDTSTSPHVRLRRLSLGVLSLFAALAIAFPATGVSSAEAASPFVGRWQATDPADGSDIRLAISGPPTGPFQITWTESYINFCAGEAGIVRGMGWLDPDDANHLQASLRVECFETGNYVDFDYAWRYHPFTDTLSSFEGNGVVTVWTHPGHVQDQPAALNLRVNYGDDWVEAFYEAGHTVWITVTESDGLTVKASAEAFTGTVEWWDTETGFQTADESWVPSLPDIAPGDWVFGWVDNGASAQVQIGDITTYFDLTTDTLTGSISAPWYVGEVQVGCFPWPGPEPQPEPQFAVLPNGLSEFSCSWTDVWNIRLRDGVDVAYAGSDGQLVMSGFDVPNGQFLASAFGDWLWLHGFGQQVQVTISVFEDQSPGQFPLWQDERTTNDDGFAQVTSSDFNRDLLPGNYITVSGPTIKKDLVLVPITVELFDVDEDRMMGTAPPGSEVWVAAGMEESQDGVTVIADATTGWWEADLTGIVDMTDDMRGWSYAQIWDWDADVNEADPPWPVDLWVNTVDDVRADDGYCTLREAVIAANTNTSSGGMDGECPAGLDWETDTIILQPDRIYSLTLDSTFENGAIDGDLDIWNNNAPTDLVIKVDGEGPSTISQDAAVDDRVVQNLGATVVIRRLTFTGGVDVSGGGGGGLFNNGSLTLINSAVSGNSAPYGGGITNWDGTLILSHSTVSGNEASMSGAGIHNQDGGNVSIENGSLIAGNTSPSSAGIENWGGSTVSITQSTISDNVATKYIGGGIANWGVLHLDGATVSGNSANDGGGIANWGGTVTLLRSTLEANHAAWGGGMVIWGGSVEVDGTSISGNTASSGEGGIQIKEALVTIRNSSSVDNNRGEWGAGIANWGGTLTVDGSSISGNEAILGAGGLLNKDNNGRGGTATIRGGSVISGNTASGGSGISNWGPATLVIDASTISNNSATAWNGGGLWNSGTATITGSAFLNNTSSLQGGAISSSVDVIGATTVSNSCIVGNTDAAVSNERTASQALSGNWWGDASGPSGAGPGTGDSVGAYIDYSGWLSSAPAICAP